MSFTADLNEIVEKNENGLLAKAPSWQRVPLRDVSEILNGYPFDSKSFSKDVGVPLIRIRDINSRHTETRFSGQFFDGFWADFGEIVVGMDGDFNAARWRGERALLNQRVAKLTPDERFVDKRFFFYALGGYLKAINANTPSVTVKHLSSRTIGDIPMPLAPLAEQRRIADKLDAMLARVDATHARLERVPVLIKRFKQAVLAAATSGVLTEDWRAERCDAGIWRQMRASDVCEKVQSGGTPKEGFSESGVPFLKVYNIVDQRIEFDYKPQCVFRRT